MHGDTESRRRARRGNRLALVGLFAVFVVPILTAYALNVWWPNWSPFGRMNHGELVEPAWEIELGSIAEHAAGRWILLYPMAGPCDDACEARVELVKRVHVALGKDYRRMKNEGYGVEPADYFDNRDTFLRRNRKEGPG